MEVLDLLWTDVAARECDSEENLQGACEPSRSSQAHEVRTEMRVFSLQHSESHQVCEESHRQSGEDIPR